MNKEASNASGYTWMVNTFEKVDGTTLKLSDLAFAEALNPGVGTLYVLNKDGATLIEDGKSAKFVYLHPGKVKTGLVAGWYYQGTNSKDMTGPGSAGWANDYSIPYGAGFGVFRTTTSITLVFSGTVRNSDAEIEATNASGYTWTGNVMPVDATLGDLSIKEVLNPGVGTLYILNKDGATLVEDGKSAKFVYLHPGKVKTGLVAGWYYQGTNSKDMTGPGSAGWANDYPIKAGQGFGMFRTTTSVTLVVPSPLADAE